eukprot:3149221-Rhodomonas_salina.1
MPRKSFSKSLWAGDSQGQGRAEKHQREQEHEVELAAPAAGGDDLVVIAAGRLALAALKLHGSEAGPTWLAKQSAMVDDIALLHQHHDGSGSHEQGLQLLILMCVRLGEQDSTDGAIPRQPRGARAACLSAESRSKLREIVLHSPSAEKLTELERGGARVGASGLVVPVSVVFAALEGLAALSAQLSPAEAAAAARSIAGLLVNSGEEEEALQSACLEVLQM